MREIDRIHGAKGWRAVGEVCLRCHHVWLNKECLPADPATERNAREQARAHVEQGQALSGRAAAEDALMRDALARRQAAEEAEDEEAP